MDDGGIARVQAEVDGKYTLGPSLGTGAGGETFEATDLRDGTTVALKRLALTNTRDWKAVDLFQREARVLAALDHPSIPRYRDSFVIETKDGPVSYLAHDFAPGRSLRGWTESGWRPKEDEVIRIGAFLLEVLAYLHALTPPVIHRDIKPANVIRSDDGRLWLVDFGAVRDATVSMAGGSTVAGTYGYMAPEQFRGHAVGESDIYGVGATLLYLLSGRSPTEFPQRELKVHFRGHFDCSKPLEAWLNRALEPAPEHRFPSATAALAALRGDRKAMAPVAPRRSRKPLVALLATLGVISIGGAAFIVNDLRSAKSSSPPVLTPNALPPRPPSAFQMLRRAHVFEGPQPAAIWSLASSHDGRKYVSGAKGGAKIWDAERETVERVLAGHESEVVSIVFTSDDRRIITSGGTSVRIWDANTGAQTATIEVPYASQIAITSDDKLLLAASLDGTIRVFDLATRALIRSIVHGAPISALRLTPDGTKLASGDSKGTLKLWSLSDGAALSSQDIHRGGINAIAFSPDGRSIATGSEDHTAHLGHFDSTLRLEKELSWSHEDIVFGVIFGTDGNHVFSTGREGAVIIASAVDGHVLSTHRNPHGVSLAFPFFTKDNRALIAAGGPSIMRFPMLRHGVGTKLPEARPEPATPVTTEPARELYEEAMQAIRLGRPAKESEAKLAAAETANPKSPLPWIGRARLAYDAAYRHDDKYDPAGLVLARKHLETAAGLGPKPVEWWSLSARIALAEKLSAAARDAIRECHAVAPDQYECLYAESMLEASDGHHEKAVTLLTDLVRTKPLGSRLGAVYGELGESYIELGDIDAAEDCYQRRLALDPKSAQLHGNHSYFLLHTAGDVKSAIEEARTALSLQDYGYGRWNLAAALTERAGQTTWNHGDRDDALRDYDEAIRLHADEFSYYGRAAIYRETAVQKHDPGSATLARADLKKAVLASPNWPLAKNALNELSAVEAYAKQKP